VQDIRALRAHGIDLEDIKKAIRKATSTGEEKLDKLLDDVVARNQRYYTDMVDLAGVTAPERLVSHEDIYAIHEQTRGQYRNITQSMGFLVRQGRSRVMLPPAKVYQWAMDSALLQVQSGAVSYNQAIGEAVRQLADSGLKTVEYESGYKLSVDSAVRMCVMTGVNQLNQKYREQSMDYLETDLVEVTAHLGARNIDGPNGWENHAKWQGGVYRWAAKPKASNGKYPDFEDTCGYGSVTGIGGANCKHSYWPFIEGVSERTYTDSELEAMKPENRPKIQFEGREYDNYQAAQKQRQIERTVRKLKRRKTAFEAAGLTEEAQAANIRLHRLNQEYKAFSKAAGLPEQRERMKMSYVDDASKAEAAKILEKRAKSGIMEANMPKEIPDVRKVCDLDIKKYQCVTPDIRTSEVIITDERIRHIQERHPNDFERFSGYIKEIVEKPDYIISDERPNTALVLKKVEEQGERFRLALRLVTPADNPNYMNSIITFMKIREKEWDRLLRNKNILYKSE